MKGYEITYSGIEEFSELNKVFKSSGLIAASYIDYNSLQDIRRRVEVQDNLFYFDENMGYYRTDFVSHAQIQGLKSISYKDFIKLVKNKKKSKWKSIWKEK